MLMIIYDKFESVMIYIYMSVKSLNIQAFMKDIPFNDIMKFVFLSIINFHNDLIEKLLSHNAHLLTDFVNIKNYYLCIMMNRCKHYRSDTIKNIHIKQIKQ